MQIRHAFFLGVERHRVLDFTYVQLSSLPPSLFFLTNLETLCLNYYVRRHNINWKAQEFRILSLIRSNILELPKDIGSLTHLQLLDLSGSFKLKVIPSNVISSLVELEELYMEGNSLQWEVKGVNNEGDNISLVKLKHLSRLVTLELQIQDVNNLPKDLLFEKLERYKVFIGDVWNWSDECVISKTLKLKKEYKYAFRGWN